MPTSRSAAALPPLTDDDVASLRAKVKAGEKPRVVIRAASAAVAAGTRGNVIRMGDPKEGEYVVVRLGKDEVPFAPNELSIPGRPGSAPQPASAPRPTSTGRPAKATAAARARKKTPARGGKRLAPLTVTLRFRDSGWTVEAQRGARRIARAAPLRPGAVSALAEHLDDDTLRDALVEAVESCRSVVEAERAELRARLEAAEASLRDYDTRPRRRSTGESRTPK
ncbi:MAG TPA: hypothetical protein VHE57_11325 [Mycobacteriales bacterium]|nr:hypothetical protein [Mycobacteriales bacterium]